MQNPLQIFQEKDSPLFSAIGKTRELAFQEGAISVKHKFLMAMTVDIVVGATNGVRVLAEQAIQEGATKEEITEAVRIAYFITGVGSVYTAAEALQGIL
jgi:alkylhydroperoxidase/carboxymuconolactone decarboxylase family protein YurZ